MNYIKFLKKYRVTTNLGLRILKIIARYGFNENQLKDNIINYIKDCNRHGIRPTFPALGYIIDKYHTFFSSLGPSDAEIALHGYRHRDHTAFTIEELRDSFESSYMAFQKAGISFSGIRFPYLRTNETLLDLTAKMPVEYDNSKAILWNIKDWKEIKSRKVIQKMLLQYNPGNPEEEFVLPHFRNNLVQIPVSLPDDDLLWDRAGIRNKRKLLKIWLQILEISVERGELFVLVLHPERYHYLDKVFKKVLKEVQNKKDLIWTPSLKDVAFWWKKRSSFSVQCKFNGENKVKIQITKPDELNYTIYNYEAKRNIKFTGIAQSDMTIEQFETDLNFYPVIGVGPDTSIGFRKMLTNLGFWIDDEAGDPNNYSVFFENDPIKESNYKWFLQFMEKLDRPLIRFNSWPEQYKSAFVVSGDIEALKAQDFFSRI